MYFYIIFLDSEPGESLSLFLLLRVISDIFIIFFFLERAREQFFDQKPLFDHQHQG